MASAGSNRPIAIYGAIVANFVIAVTKFLAAAFTGSSAMLSEGIHSLVDTGNQLLLLLGVHRGRQPPDPAHPFGHGKELYFWGLMVAVLLFGVGGGMAVYEGISHLQHPGESQDPTWNYAVLGIAFLFEGTSWGIALRELRRRQRSRSFWKALRASKDPSVFTVLVEDSAAIAGVIVAGLGVFLGHHFQNPVFDAAASIIIGLILGTAAGFLVYETRGLLIGESADREILQRIHELARAEPAVEEVQRPLTMHFGPEEILLNMEIRFRPKLSIGDLAAAIDRLEKNIRRACPQVKHIYIEAASLRGDAQASA